MPEQEGQKEVQSPQQMLQEAAQLLQQAEQERLRKCHAMIQQALQSYGCELDVQLSFTPDGRVVGSPIIMPTKQES